MNSLIDNRLERSNFRLFKQAYQRSDDSSPTSSGSIISSSGSGSSTSSNNINGICNTPDSRSGICYDATECTERGGVPMGRCSNSISGSSVCCLFEASCGDEVREKHSYFRSPGYPATFDQPQLCRLKITKSSNIKNNQYQKQPICQLKLQFVEFDLSKPVEGNCTQDIFSISGQNENNIIPRICGYNTGQHCEL